MYSKNLKTDNLKNDGKVEVGNDLKRRILKILKILQLLGKSQVVMLIILENFD
ncbi:hypothetical protein HW276_11475 [Leptotrichia sp. oral taxon 417]|uniref:hypothetical protein n=1 Tax=Leptotrichia sp. oral taxon 417 TaxID=712365 RepID=UPI0015B9C033|nr:hypothetical protein [Leptotrichia sp. oral taxon 417]NWO28308.1 hypothetical protein [Leptotrichia sp. oral taxon 417]